jgi:hypothetical protein
MDKYDGRAVNFGNFPFPFMLFPPWSCVRDLT